MQAVRVRDATSGHIRELGDETPVLQLSALRTAAESPLGGTSGDTVFAELEWLTKLTGQFKA